MKQLVRHVSPLLLVAASVCAAAAAGCSTVARGFCDAQAECDDAEALIGFDAVGGDNDSADVCVARWEGELAALRANEEEICVEVAEALEAYMTCVARVYAEEPRDACDGLKVSFLLGGDNPCGDEIDDYFELLGEAGDDCSANEE